MYILHLYWNMIYIISVGTAINKVILNANQTTHTISISCKKVHWQQQQQGLLHYSPILQNISKKFVCHKTNVIILGNMLKVVVYSNPKYEYNEGLLCQNFMIYSKPSNAT
jgi:hypothetical protein